MNADDDPMTRNPLKFEDVAFGAHALEFFQAAFSTPREALHCLRDNPFPPDAFWQSL